MVDLKHTSSARAVHSEQKEKARNCNSLPFQSPKRKKKISRESYMLTTTCNKPLKMEIPGIIV
jgi:hypothetical protein